MPELTLDTAKAVVEKAVEFEAWSWDDPSAVTDEVIADTAKTIVDTVKQAALNDSVAPAVLEILRLSGTTEMSPVTLEAYEQRFGKVESNGNGAPPAPEPVSADSPGVREPEPEPAPQEQSALQEQAADGKLEIEDIFPGYDDLKAADIKKAILDSAASGDLTEEEWARILAYEEANEDRKTIRTLQPEFKAPEPEPVPEPQPTGNTFENNTTAPSAQGSFTVSGPGVPPTTYAHDQTPGEDDVAAFYAGNSPSRAQQEGLPIPGNVDFSQHPPILPVDITTTADSELSQTATLFHSLFARAQWLQSQEEGRERAAEHLENEAHHDAYAIALAQHESAIPDDKRTAAAVENARRAAGHDADGAAAVRAYRSRKVRHGIDARELKALAAGYDKAVWRINEELGRRARLATTRPS